jgi:two-component system chemotaxis sensor kinase CheA
MSELDAVVKEFLVESHENLDQLDRDLVALEKAPRDGERLASVFRTIHTIKGTCGFLGYVKLGAVTHAGENLLSRLRDGQLLLGPEITNGLLALVDAVRTLLGQIEARGAEGDGDYTALIATLTRLQDGEWASAAPAPPPAPKAEAPAEERPAEPGGAGLAEGTIRVDVGLLDRLMNLVGELVLARNQVLQYAATRPGADLQRTSQRLNLITTELQEGVMKTRMQPIGNVWKTFPRVVRDLAQACGKKVRLDLEGEETELDKTIIEAIKGPLTHLVRNAVDHGIEPPALRAERGKPAEGHLLLRAYHEGGQVNIEMTDDGGGIDGARVKHKALERGLVGPEQAARLSERELLQLIFLPGFSTAEKVSTISGRGVGMDVVKTNIEKIGGAVDLASRPGRGTVVKIKIPLTLAIIPALIVTSGGDRYALPQVSLLELVRLEGEQARRGIERVHDVPVYRLRGNLLPLVYLDRELQLEVGPRDSEPEAVNIVVLQADGRPFGLVVEAINDTEEIVVKPLGKLLKSIPLFAGATIMGDGKVALILDVLGVAQSAGILAEGRQRALAADGGPASRGAEGEALLLFGAGEGRRMAMPLAQVARLEEVPRAAVERSALGEVVQYRGQVMPLVRLAPAAAGDGPLQVVVCSDQGRRVGLVVERILDIVSAPAERPQAARADGAPSPAIIQGRVTDLLDVPGFLDPRRGGQ